MPSIPTMSPSVSSYSTPSRLSRALSPPASTSSYTTTVTPFGTQQKLNLVTRVAIEGKAKQADQDSVSIQMYLKISLPVDSVTPGSTVQLFPEENVKILTSQVHPLDTNSVPYDFDSTVSPLLSRAARALKLPERSKQTFQSAFGLGPTDSVPVVDTNYTGTILVSAYHVSYVLPKIFPSQPKSISRRRSSVGERNHVQFMAAIDLLVPYLSHPPRSPYLLSIPTPRCLHNNISLRIFPPSNPNISSSFASLSSTDNDDSGSWDLASEPHVTRTTSSRSRANSYNNFADDESSDSSTVGFSYGCGIRGTFPSAERIRVRWAKPTRSLDFGTDGASDGRRRVGVKDVKGEMTCVVRGKTGNGVLMDVSYRGTCKGIWYPGVATLLGMDVGLLAKNSDVSWAEGFPDEWEVNGGTGYTGFDVGLNQRASRHDSMDSNSGQPNIHISPSSPNGNLQFPRASAIASRQSSTSSNASTSSLLRAPLPTQIVQEYSFEGSPTASGTLSSQTSESLSSLPASVSTNVNSQSQSQFIEPRAPSYPITLHVNMNELLPAARNPFIFSISGTILVTPRSTSSRVNGSSINLTNSGSDSDTDLEFKSLPLPRFTVHAADSETTSMVVKNDLPDGGIVEVYKSSTSTSSSSSSAGARTALLKKGALTKSGADDARIVVKLVPAPAVNGITPQTNERSTLRPPSRPMTPNGSGSTGSRSSSPINGVSARIPRTSSVQSLNSRIGTSYSAAAHPRPTRDGPLMIPWVNATVTPLVSSSESNRDLPEAYAVRLRLPAPANADSEWLEFGLAKPGGEGSGSKDSSSPGKRPPKVDIVNVSLEGVPVRYETTAATKHEPETVDVGGVKFGEMSSKEWISWIRVRVAGAGGGEVVVDYVVRTVDDASDGKKGKRKARDEVMMDVYLPSFSLPVGRLEVAVENTPGLELSSLRTNLRHSPSPKTKQRLLHFSTEAFFYPHLSFFVRREPNRRSSRTATYLSLLNLLATIFALVFLTRLRWNVHHLGQSLDSYAFLVGSGWNDVPEPITVTTTAYSSPGARWWMGDSPTSESSSESVHVPISSFTSPLTSTVTALSTFPAASGSEAKETFRPSPQETNALVPMSAVLKFQWADFEPMVQSASKRIKETAATLWSWWLMIYY